MPREPAQRQRPHHPLNHTRQGEKQLVEKNSLRGQIPSSRQERRRGFSIKGDECNQRRNKILFVRVGGGGGVRVDFDHLELQCRRHKFTKSMKLFAIGNSMQPFLTLLP